MALPIVKDDLGFCLVHPEWSGETVNCCDVCGCTNTEPWHRIRQDGDLMLCDEHFDPDDQTA